jgi:hypothetical protein
VKQQAELVGEEAVARNERSSQLVPLFHHLRTTCAPGRPGSDAKLTKGVNENSRKTGLREELLERKSCSSPDGVLDHLFDHLSVSVYGVPCGSTDLPKSANRLSTGVHGAPWELRGP